MDLLKAKKQGCVGAALLLFFFRKQLLIDGGAGRNLLCSGRI
jgi:hypothetical protein